MRRIQMTVLGSIVTTLCLLAASHAPAAEKLSDVLRESKWDDIVGTWVDADGKGDYKVTYAWKLPDRVIETRTKYRGVQSVGLMGVNAKNGDVFHMGADSTGGSSLGRWEIADNGDAVLSIVFTDGDGQEGVLNIRHHREDKDTVLVTLELPQPVKIKLVRAKK